MHNKKNLTFSPNAEIIHYDPQTSIMPNMDVPNYLYLRLYTIGFIFTASLFLSAQCDALKSPPYMSSLATIAYILSTGKLLLQIHLNPAIKKIHIKHELMFTALSAYLYLQCARDYMNSNHTKIQIYKSVALSSTQLLTMYNFAMKMHTDISAYREKYSPDTNPDHSNVPA